MNWTGVPGSLNYRADDSVSGTDDWSAPILVLNIDLLFIDVELSPGHELELQWGNRYGDFGGNQDAIRVKAGANSWDNMAKFGYGSFRVRNRVAGNDATYAYEAHGLPQGV